MLSTTWDQLFLDYLPPQVLCPPPPFCSQVPERVQKWIGISVKMSWKVGLKSEDIVEPLQHVRDPGGVVMSEKLLLLLTALIAVVGWALARG